MGSNVAQRGRWLAGLLALAGGCAFESDGSGGGITELEETQGSSGAGTAAATGGESPTSGSTLATDGQGGTTTDLTTSTMTSGGESSSGDPSEPRAALVFVDPAPIDLGTRPLAGPEAVTLELTNVGDAAAQILGAEDPPAPLIWAGGTFPGLEGTCQGPIPPNATCTVQLAVDAGDPGLAAGALEVRFDDLAGTGSAKADITMIASGRGPNLIINPDAETGDLTGWAAEGSSFEAHGEHNHEPGGSRSFYAGNTAQTEMSQEIGLDAWADSIDALPMSFHFVGWTRAYSSTLNDDPHDIHVTFLDASQTVLGAEARTDMNHSSWQSTAFDSTVPAGTRRVRIRLSCDRELGTNCSAWFDDFSGALGYEP